MGKYFDLSNAWGELRSSYGAGEKASAIAKLVGKGLANTAVFGVTEVVPSLAKAAMQQKQSRSSELLKRNDLSDEQRERFQRINQKSTVVLENMEALGEKSKVTLRKIETAREKRKLEKE